MKANKSLNTSKTIAKYVNGKIYNCHNKNTISDVNNYVKLETAIEMLKDILTDLLEYRGAGSGIVRAFQSYSEIILNNDIAAEQFNVTIKRPAKK